MDLSGGAAVVVDEAKEALSVGALERHFFGQFPAHSSAVGVGRCVAVLLIAVAADAQRAEGAQAGLSAGPAAPIVEDLAAEAQRRKGISCVNDRSPSALERGR